MKAIYTTTLLALLLLFCDGLSAQIFSYDFEQCNVGDKVSETLGEPWTTWNNAPGSSEDAVITDEFSLDSKALKIDNGNDLVLKLGDQTTGAYNMSFDMYIPEGKEGYFNILHVFNGSNSIWAQQIWLNSEAYGNNFSPGGEYSDFEVPYDEWFHIDIDVYLDDALACLKLNDKLIIVWDYTRYSTAKYCSLAAMNFYPSNQTSAEKNGFFIDNVTFTELEGPFFTVLVPEDETIDEVMLKEEEKTIVTSITNEGNGICQLTPWIDFGVGQAGGTPKDLHYDNDPYYTFGNYNLDPYIEIGVHFPLSQLIESDLIGTKITKMQYYVPMDASYGCEGPLKFSIYRWDSEMSTLLAEKELSDYIINAWNTVEFDEPIPITGFGIGAVVGFQQINGGYPISLDAGPAKMYIGDLVRINHEENGWFSLNFNYITYNGGEGYGNHNIRLICEGLPVEARWVSTSFDNYISSLMFVPGQSHSMEFALNAAGLDYGDYNATLKMDRKGMSLPAITIPIHLKVSGTDVDEMTERQPQIYPNPASDQIYVEGDDLRYAIFFNALGEQVGLKKIDSNTIHVNDLTNGVYHVCLLDARGHKTVYRLVISK